MNVGGGGVGSLVSNKAECEEWLDSVWLRLRLKSVKRLEAVCLSQWERGNSSKYNKLDIKYNKAMFYALFLKITIVFNRKSFNVLTTDMIHH